MVLAERDQAPVIVCSYCDNEIRDPHSAIRDLTDEGYDLAFCDENCQEWYWETERKFHGGGE